VYKQSSIQRLDSLDNEFLEAPTRFTNEHSCYVARVEKLISDVNAELRRRGSHAIPIELEHGQILATVGPEY